MPRPTLDWARAVGGAEAEAEGARPAAAAGAGETAKGAESTAQPARRLGRKVALALLCVAVIGGMLLYRDAKTAEPWFNVHDWGFHFKGEGPTGFRMSFVGDTRGSVNPQYSTVKPRPPLSHTHLYPAAQT